MALLGNGAISTNKKATIGNLVESLIQQNFFTNIIYLMTMKNYNGKICRFIHVLRYQIGYKAC